ncbi:MAG: cytochrome c biosis protein CcmG, thiol:disulfide interchange protein DsbE [Solirubrobacteraceae bacterium]|nr:cytochrome c biosis protein CcmG, thiol:disulfide interchange protein DsbE [Solirubrobacteraceae bacterium]
MVSGNLIPSTLQPVKRFLGPALAAAVAAAALALLVFGLGSQGESRALDNAVDQGRLPLAPDHVLPVLGGTGTRSLASYRGRVVVLNFWASWCDPCAAEAPLLEQAQRQLAATGGGTVLGVAYKDLIPDSLGFVRTQRLTYPSLRDSDGKLAGAYGTDALPETFVLDRRSRVVAISRGQITRPTFLTQAIAKAQAQ